MIKEHVRANCKTKTETNTNTRVQSRKQENKKKKNKKSSKTKRAIKDIVNKGEDTELCEKALLASCKFIALETNFSISTGRM